MASAIALIVAGSGETNEKEVFDLIEDGYPEDVYNEVTLVVPVDKDLYTKAVQHVVAWYPGDSEEIFAVQTKGASLTRASAKLGSGNEEVEKFSDILDKAEFEDFDEVHFLIAMPEDPDDPDYDLYAEFVEVAIENGIAVKDLTKGLDDVTLAEDEPDPEPEPEPEKPARKPRSRKKAEEVTEEPEAAEEPPGDSLEAQLAHAHDEVVSKSESKAVVDAWNVFGQVVRYLEAEDQVNALANQADVRYRPLTEAARAAYDSLAGLPAEKPAQESVGPDPAVTRDADPDKPSRGRGRPRTNFEVKQVWDDEEDGWIPRPKGRMRKGTKWRTIHAETDEVLEEGTA